MDIKDTRKEFYVLSQMDMIDMSNFIRSFHDMTYAESLLDFKHPVALLCIHSTVTNPDRIGIQQLIGCIDVKRQKDSIIKANISVCLRKEFLDIKMFKEFIPTIYKYISAMGFTEASIGFVSNVDMHGENLDHLCVQEDLCNTLV